MYKEKKEKAEIISVTGKRIGVALIAMVLIFSGAMGLVTMSMEENTGGLILDGVILKIALVSVLFFSVFSLLRIRDWMLNTEFPIHEINKDPKAAAFYYGTSFFSVIIATSIIVS